MNRLPSRTRSACGLALAAALAACGSTADLPTAVSERGGRPQPLFASSRTGAEAALAIERVMDDADKLKLAHVLELSNSSTTVTWRNAQTGNEFTLTPMRGHGGEHGPCREFSVDATVKGITDRLRGTACQGSDTRWRVLR
ncbi:RT0821/Lpp0805 family surface protein [Aquabacterium sp.]|uniref:RT0821/Lpp0805 family surface protein n=1 Tax=Aquabacterium sp. TaxID=1872578 RepID=UPI002BBD3E66|nr:RT0821/Lpp0805 family surface protein [Aquabacterium sp.]HSW06923.1 RT0821/Lpp0805 family surface protein [Aquabacterium sp.]